MKTEFSPISKSQFIDKYIKSNPSESKKNFTRAIDPANPIGSELVIHRNALKRFVGFFYSFLAFLFFGEGGFDFF
jgi:hypothetical protein